MGGEGAREGPLQLLEVRYYQSSSFRRVTTLQLVAV